MVAVVFYPFQLAFVIGHNDAQDQGFVLASLHFTVLPSVVLLIMSMNTEMLVVISFFSETEELFASLPYLRQLAFTFQTLNGI